MSSKSLERKFLKGVDRVPTLTSLSPKLEKGPLDRPLVKTVLVKKIKSWMEVGDPIISAAFDVATGKHMVELSERELAMKFLGPEGAIREIGRSASSGFLTKEEADRLTKKLNRILNEIGERGLSDVWKKESLLYDLWNIQIFLDKRHYASFLLWLKRS